MPQQCQVLNPRHHNGNSLGTLLLEQHQHDSQDTLWEAQGQWMPPRGGAQGTSGFASFLPGTSQEVTHSCPADSSRKEMTGDEKGGDTTTTRQEGDIACFGGKWKI